MSTDTQLPAADDERRYVFVELARCTHCNSSKLKPYKTEKTDECHTRYCRCEDCGGKCIVVAT